MDLAYTSEMSEEVHMLVGRHVCPDAVVSSTWFSTHAHLW